MTNKTENPFSLQDDKTIEKKQNLNLKRKTKSMIPEN